MLEKRGDLDQVIKAHKRNGEKIQDAKILKWTVEILDGLEFFHSHQVVHLDIKPA